MLIIFLLQYWFMLSTIFVVEHLFNINGYSEILRSMYGTRLKVDKQVPFASTDFTLQRDMT